MLPKPRAKPEAKARAFASRYDADMDISEGIPCTECEGRFFQTWEQLTLHMFRHHGIRMNQLGAWALEQLLFEKWPGLLDDTEGDVEAAGETDARAVAAASSSVPVPDDTEVPAAKRARRVPVRPSVFSGEQQDWIVEQCRPWFGNVLHETPRSTAGMNAFLDEIVQRGKKEGQLPQEATSEQARQCVRKWNLQ